MNVNEIIILIDRLEKSEISEFYVKDDKFELNIIKTKPAEPVQTIIRESAHHESMAPVSQHAPVPAVQPQPVVAAPVPAVNPNDFTVKSPLVGIYYSSPSPDKPVYKNIGDTVKEGEVICILEAMKIFNEVKSPCSGIVKEILVTNQDIVEYDQPLMIIERTN
ncbi:MAG: acetyl-CoA carboxylase biotin carboxyl carrier protein [Eubacteriaceae bacterium]|nr:acetyl-CoA carboxylase biotin carboxyl carrier protein [Eubacteriaceae bacterium]